jgi:hypothetical protein
VAANGKGTDVSDSTNQGGAGGDFRGSREEKRQDETVMISSDNLSNLVNEAKATPPGASPEPAPAAAGSSGPNLLIIGIGVVLILAIVIALVYSFAKA